MKAHSIKDHTLMSRCLVEAETCEERAQVHRDLAKPFPYRIELSFHMDEAIRLEKKAEAWLEKAVRFEGFKKV